jgi:hypothetical protein
MTRIDGDAAAGSLVFVDPVEDLTVLFMTQVFPNVLGAGYRTRTAGARSAHSSTRC